MPHKGYKQTPEHRAKLSAALKGYKQTESHRRKIANALRGKPKPEEHRRKLSAALMGRFRGEQGIRWKGGKNKQANGYVLVYCPSHPHAYNGKYVPEHRLVMEELLGRFLSPEEIVHHKNGERDDNRRENLSLFPGVAEHLSYHREGETP